jgi:hypothetical protein
MKNLIFTIITVIAVLSCSCDSTEPPITPPAIIVNNSIELTEEWKDLTSIKIKFTKSETDTISNYEYKLLTSTGKEIVYPKIIGEDTSFIHTSLSEGQIVSFKVEAFEARNLKDTSSTLTLTTLSATSHSIAWEVDTLGQAGDYLRDIWGIDGNNVWAVGGIETEQGRTAIIKWDGQNWNYHSWPEGAVYGIYGFLQSDLWCVGEWANRGFLGHFDGTVWTEYNYEYFEVKGDTVYPLREIWGSSPNDVWAAGDKGTLIHWDGIEWTKINTDITEEITALYGTADNDIYLAATSGNRSVLYHYNGTEWLKLNDILGMYAITMWKKPGGNLIIGGTNFVEYTHPIYQQISIPGRTRGVIKVFGSDHNNIFTAGDFGEITHFDGRTWTDISLFEVPDGTYRVLRSVWCTEEKVFIVGVDQNRAIIISGLINQ